MYHHMTVELSMHARTAHGGHRTASMCADGDSADLSCSVECKRWPPTATKDVALSSAIISMLQTALDPVDTLCKAQGQPCSLLSRGRPGAASRPVGRRW